MFKINNKKTLGIIFIILGILVSKNSFANEQNIENSMVNYCSHIEEKGWEKEFSNSEGEISGTTGQSKRLEAIKIITDDSKINSGIKYQVHVQEIGWQNWKQNGEIAGTTGKGLRLEAIKIELIDNPNYTVEYRVHVQDIGWQKWKKDGDIAGTTGKSLRIEAIQIRIVEKDNTPIVEYKSHVQEIGWQDSVRDGGVSGTIGKNYRIEAMNIKTYNLPEGVSIKYQAHIQEVGWQPWKNEGEMVGTTGKERRLEGIKIKLDGTDKYSIMYRAHVEYYGWQEWVYNGETAGTVGEKKRLEAIEIKIVDKITEEKTKLYLDPPSSNLTNEIHTISGYLMTNVQNKELQILIDDEPIDVEIRRKSEQSVYNKIKGFGGEELNPEPKFYVDIDFSKYSLGMHTITVQAVLENGDIIQTKSRTVNIVGKIQYSTGTYGKSGLLEKGDSKGSLLKYYKYGSGPNVFFATYCIHGFEDNWANDGSELVKIAEQFWERLKASNDYDLANKWTIYILPTVNPDGVSHGWTNNGPGRTTLYSSAPSNKGIDLNRSWSVDFSYIQSDRNYTGTEPFQAFEARYLRDFLLTNKSANGQTVLVDLHGWTQQLIGDSTIRDYYRQYFPENTDTATYGKGYLINWARVNLSSSAYAAKAGLIELPRNNYSHADVTTNNLSNRYIEATLAMLRGINTNIRMKTSGLQADSSLYEVKTEYDGREYLAIKSEIQYKVAFAGIIKQQKPTIEETYTIYDENYPTENGIWIDKKNRQAFMKILEENTNSKYEINEKGYLTVKNINEPNENDKIIQKILNSNKKVIITINSIYYEVDTVTGKIVEYPFEKLDNLQACDKIQNNNDKIIIIASNSNQKLTNKEIFKEVIMNLD